MTTNQTIDGVPGLRSLLERCARELSIGIGPAPKSRAQELRALLDEPAYPNRLCHVDYNAHPHICGCLKGDEEAQRRHDEKFGTPAAQHHGETVAQKYDDTLLPFVALMRKELHANAGKGDRPGWLAMSSDTCLLEIIYHFGKLQASVKRGDGDGIAEYAADVANLCMMLLDICGALESVEQPAPVAVASLEVVGRQCFPSEAMKATHGYRKEPWVDGDVDQVPSEPGFYRVEPLVRLSDVAATVAVVLPERIPTGQSIELDAKASGWNACLDEVSRLNPSL